MRAGYTVLFEGDVLACAVPIFWLEGAVVQCTANSVANGAISCFDDRVGLGPIYGGYQIGSTVLR